MMNPKSAIVSVAQASKSTTSSLAVAISVAVRSRPLLLRQFLSGLLVAVSRCLLRSPGRRHHRGPAAFLFDWALGSAMYELAAHCIPASGLMEMMRAELERERGAREVAEADARDTRDELRSLRETVHEMQSSIAQDETQFERLAKRAQESNKALIRQVDRLKQSTDLCAPSSDHGTPNHATSRPPAAATATRPLPCSCCSCGCSRDGAVVLAAIQRLGSLLGFTAGGVPVASVLLFRCTYHVEDLRAETAEQLEHTLREAARHASAAASCDSAGNHHRDGGLQPLSYWLSSSAWLMALLQQHAAAPGPFNSVPSGPLLLDTSLTSSNGSQSPCGGDPEGPAAAAFRALLTPGLRRRMLEAAMALQGPLVSLVGSIRADATDRLLPLLDALVRPPRVQEEGEEEEDAATRQTKGESKGPGGVQGPAEAVLECLRNVFSALEANVVPGPIVSVLYQQLAAIADVWLLNKLLLRRELCGAATLGPLARHLHSMAVAPAVSQQLPGREGDVWEGVDAVEGADGMPATGLVLPRVTQAVRLLLRPEALQSHPGPKEAAAALFPALGGPQVLRLSHNAKIWATPGTQLPPSAWLEPPEHSGRRDRLHMHVAGSSSRHHGSAPYIVDPRPELRTQAQLGGGGGRRRSSSGGGSVYGGSVYGGSVYGGGGGSVYGGGGGSVPSSPGSTVAPPSPPSTVATLTGAKQMHLGLDVASACGTFVSLPSAVLLLEDEVDYCQVLWRGH